MRSITKLLARLALVLIALVAFTAPALAAAPSNDTFGNAKLVTIGFSETIDTTEATTDDDDKRLQRYLTEMKFPFPVARMNAEQAEKLMGFDNLPATFYVDVGGVVRYYLNGSESHGDSPMRVAWYIDQIKQFTKQ